MASARENEDFISSVVSWCLLDDAIKYIKENIDIEDVYGIDYLNEYIGENSYPEDVFEYDKLEEWALEKGFVKEKNDE